MISHSKSEESLGGHKRMRQELNSRLSRERQQTILEMDMRKLDASVRRLFPHAKKKGSIISGIGHFRLP